jgi:hypothetical protein
MSRMIGLVRAEARKIGKMAKRNPPGATAVAELGNRMRLQGIAVGQIDGEEADEVLDDLGITDPDQRSDAMENLASWG